MHTAPFPGHPGQQRWKPQILKPEMSSPVKQGLQMLSLAQNGCLWTPGAKDCQDALLLEFLFTERRKQELPEHSCPWLLMVEVVQRNTGHPK